MDDENIKRLLHPWKAGDKCVAAMDVHYASYDGMPMAKEGSKGTVVDRRPSGVCMVRWSKLGQRVFATSPDSLDPEADAPRPPEQLGLQVKP